MKVVPIMYADLILITNTCFKPLLQMINVVRYIRCGWMSFLLSVSLERQPFCCSCLYPILWCMVDYVINVARHNKSHGVCPNILSRLTKSWSRKIICLNTCIDGSVQDCTNSIANTQELLQSCTKPSICISFWNRAGSNASKTPLRFQGDRHF